MKNILICTFLLLLPLSIFSQKVSVKMVRMQKTSLSEWQILDENSRQAYSGKECNEDDSVTFSMEAYKRYFLKISVSGIIDNASGLYTLVLNNEPLILVNSDIKPGDHLFPFYTGLRQVDSKITGGTTALISDFPWQVYYISGNFRCGASLINENWAVTAAHCTKNNDGSSIPAASMSIRVGSNNPRSGLDGKLYNISEAIVHENFDDQTLVNDIALLRIAGPVSYPNATPIKLISPVDVAEGATDPGVFSWVTGWGWTNISPQTYPTTLMKVQLPIVSNQQAASVWGTIPATNIMAGYLNGNKDACNGDSGGPLVVPVLGEYKLAGIVSWGSSDCNTYGAYTRISSFSTWISTKTGLTIYTPPAPVGDSIICNNALSVQYSIENITGATAYEWRIYPSEAGVITGNSLTADVLWNAAYTGSAYVMVRVTVSNTVSDWSKLKVKRAVNTVVIKQSGDTVLCAGQPLVLNTDADGYNLTYKWYQNSNLIQSGVRKQLNFSSTTPDNSGNYFCEITGSCGTVSTNTINLTVNPLTRITYISPVTEIVSGNDATIKVRSEGLNLTYQWQKNDIPVENGNDSLLTLPNVSAKDIGVYKTTVAGTCGTEVSKPVYVYVKNNKSLNEPQVLLWPSITSSECTVALSNDFAYKIKLYSTTGKLLRELTNCQYQTMININELPRGVYILNVSYGTFTKSVKLIKE